MNTSSLPDWSQAPEGATHWVDSSIACWYKHVDGTCYFWNSNGEWVDLCQSEAVTIRDYGADGIIPRPVSREWRGPQDGLPPVGTKVMFERYQCEVIGYRGHFIVCHMPDDYGLCYEGIMLQGLSPLIDENKINRDKWIEAAAEACGNLLAADGTALGKIYDAGLAKLPEE